MSRQSAYQLQLAPSRGSPFDLAWERWRFHTIPIDVLAHTALERALNGGVEVPVFFPGRTGRCLPPTPFDERLTVGACCRASRWAAILPSGGWGRWPNANARDFRGAVGEARSGARRWQPARLTPEDPGELEALQALLFQHFRKKGASLVRQAWMMMN